MSTWQRRRFTVIGLVFLARMSAAPSSHLKAQVSSADANSSLWPFSVGNSWTFQTQNGGKLTTTVITVTGVSDGKDSSTAKLEYQSGSTPLEKETYNFNSHGISRLTSGVNGASKISPGLSIVQYPLTAGATWYWKGTITTKGKATAAAAKMSASGPEKLKLPVGSLQAFKVHMDLVLVVGQRRISIPNDYWFTPGVGLVRRAATFGTSTIDSTLNMYKLQQRASDP